MRIAAHREISDFLERPFSFEELFAHPGDLSRFDETRRRKTVAVVGGGVAGLVAACELMEHGHTVVLFERTSRTGGRIFTHHFADGTHGELGAMRIPANHLATLHYANKFELRLRRFVNHNPLALYHLRSVTARISEWRRFHDSFALLPRERKDPRLVYQDLMLGAMAQLSSQEKWLLFEDELPAGRLSEFDDLTLRDRLRETLSLEAFELVGSATGMIAYQRSSFLETLIDYWGLFRVDQFELAEGMDGLTQALTRAVAHCVRYRASVTSIRLVEDGRVEVGWRTGDAFNKAPFDFVVCAVPAPAAARITFDPPLPPAQLNALQGVTYASAAKTLLHCKTRPWELFDGIYGGGSFTDLPIQQCWYPSDNADGDEGVESIAGYTGDDPLEAGARPPISTAPAPRAPASPEISHSPGVMTGAYMWEANARRFAALTESERTDAVLADVRSLHPTIDADVDEVVHWSWDISPNPGGGGFAFFSPGEHQRFQGWLGRPHPEREPRVFFAGEHLAIAHAWIQGAIQTALAAVIDVLRAGVPARPYKTAWKEVVDEPY